MTNIEQIREHALVVIPARNEASSVGEVLEKVMLLGFESLVVDDASEDDTAAMARRSGARVLKLPYCSGAWAAMQTGILYALKNGYDYVVTLDADGQHDPAAIPRLLAGFRSNVEPNVVIGSCTSRGSRGRKVAWRVLKTLGAFHVRDLTSGYRIYDRRAMEVVTSRDATLLEYQDVGVLLLLLENHLRLIEVPVEMQPRSEGKSRVFSSWFKVLYYLAYSALICLSKFQTSPRQARVA